jgi:hypothetical protein
MKPSKEPEKILWLYDYDGGKYPVCPCCNEPAYFFDKCCFCGQVFVQNDEDLKKLKLSVQIERDGYIVEQTQNNHIHIYAADGTLLSHSVCTKKMTEKELERHLEFVRMSMRRGERQDGKQKNVY